MRALILAAGEGSRLRPLTKDKPKALVELCDKTLLERQVSILQKAGITDIAIATGYKGEQIQELGFNCYHNPDYATSNIVYSLFNALPFLEREGDLIISYGDIVYELDNLKKIITSDAAVNVMVDKEWFKYWKMRFVDPLTDAESLILNDDGTIKELGLKTESYNDIQGQYIGLIKVRRDKLKALISFYHNLKIKKSSNIKDLNNMFLTDFIQLLINADWDIRAILISGGWLEVDSLKDLNLYEGLAKSKELDSYCRLDK